MTRVRLEMLAFAGALALAMSLILPWLYARLLYLQPLEAALVRRDFFILVPLVLAAGATSLRMNPGGAVSRRWVLELPSRFALATIATGELGVALGVAYESLRHRLPLTAVVGIGLSTGAILALSAVALFAFARARLQPWVIRLGDELPPVGRRLPVRARLSFTIIAVATAAAIPAAVFGAARLDADAEADARARALATARRLAIAASGLDLGQATSLLTRTPLIGESRTLLRAPSGTLLPEDAAAEVAELPYVELDLGGALSGGAVRVCYLAARPPRGPLLGVLLFGLLLTTLVGGLLAGGLEREISQLASQIQRVAGGEKTHKLGIGTTAEVRRVTDACNRLLDRLPRMTVASFLAVEQADEARRFKSQFLANMSHDLRAPLNSILGFCDLLVRGGEGPLAARHRSLLQAAHKTGLRLLRQLNEILDTAKLESGRMEIHRRRSPPAEVITQAVREAGRGRDHAERLSVELQPGLEPLLCDPLRLEQAITHLCGYALDSTSGGPVRLRAHQSDHRGAPAFVVEVTYEATLRETDQEHLFDAFHFGAEGSGGLHLTLPLARRLFELHGGTLEAVPGSPARLVAALPVERRRARTTPTHNELPKRV